MSLWLDRLVKCVMGKHFPGSGGGGEPDTHCPGQPCLGVCPSMNTLGISQLSLGPWGSQSPREKWTIQEMLTMTSP